jgi:hypothetical protein
MKKLKAKWTMEKENQFTPEMRESILESFINSSGKEVDEFLDEIENITKDRLEALKELAKQAQELKMGYEGETWRTLIYFVAAARKGVAPDIVKALDGKIFHSFEDADKFREEMSSVYNYEYKVFYAMVDVPRAKAVDGEVK